ncbi:hypothetical protein YPPY10_1894, partial [Yersinia pestis PY-10]
MSGEHISQYPIENR